jgi:rfaE bifunctional protein nucleotidyltransferase chain/domain
MIVELKELLELLEKVRGKKKIVFTNGCFDILHAGHADYLNKAKSLGDILVVGINSDASVRRIKGEKRPILPQQMRAYLLDNLKPVDYVVIFEEDTPSELIKAIKPDVLVKGADWDLERIVGADFVLSYGGRVERIPFSFDISTSKIIERILGLYCK